MVTSLPLVDQSQAEKNTPWRVEIAWSVIAMLRVGRGTADAGWDYSLYLFAGNEPTNYCDYDRKSQINEMLHRGAATSEKV
jgi:hypothetical protein